MAVGKIKKLVQEKGFGFISAGRGRRVFPSQCGADHQFENLSVGQSVEFQIDSTPNPKGKGPRASSVTPA